VEKAVIIVRRGGRVVHQAGIGGADPSSPVLLASLSKAITGSLHRDPRPGRRLGFDWPLSKALAKHFAAHGGRRTSASSASRSPNSSRIGRFASAADGEDSATRSVLEAYLGKH
jgi:hypothetical protein